MMTTLKAMSTAYEDGVKRTQETEKWRTELEHTIKQLHVEKEVYEERVDKLEEMVKEVKALMVDREDERKKKKETCVSLTDKKSFGELTKWGGVKTGEDFGTCARRGGRG